MAAPACSNDRPFCNYSKAMEYVTIYDGRDPDMRRDKDTTGQRRGLLRHVRSREESVIDSRRIGRGEAGQHLLEDDLTGSAEPLNQPSHPLRRAREIFHAGYPRASLLPMGW